MDTVLSLLSYVPVIDLFANGVNVSGSVTGFLYDVGQAVAGLHLMAKGFVKLSEATPWERDDVWAKKVVGWTTTGMEWIARFGGALQK